MKLTSTVKSVSTKSYSIVMVELLTGEYCIVYEHEDKTHRSALIKDYSVASFFFDSKLREFEGH